MIKELDLKSSGYEMRAVLDESSWCRERANGSWGRGQEANGEATFVSEVIWVSDNGGERVGGFNLKTI